VVSLQILLAGFGGCLCRWMRGLAGVVGEVGGFGLLAMVVESLFASKARSGTSTKLNVAHRCQWTKPLERNHLRASLARSC